MRCKLVEGTKENLKATVESLGVRGKMDLKPVIATVQDVIDNRLPVTLRSPRIIQNLQNVVLIHPDGVGPRQSL